MSRWKKVKGRWSELIDDEGNVLGFVREDENECYGVHDKVGNLCKATISIMAVFDDEKAAEKWAEKFLPVQ